MQAVICRNCGNTLNAGDKFCRKCGTPVTAERREPPTEIHEGTVILGGLGQIPQNEIPVKKGKIMLDLDDMLRGGTKVVDFGTGRKFEITIPAGISPGEVIKVINTGIIDPDTGMECEIELTTAIE